LGRNPGSARAATDCTRKEVVRVPVQTPPKSERQAPQPVTEPEGEGAVRALAVERIHRIRRFKLHLIVFALAIPALTSLWVLTEYYEEHTWPSRFASDPDVAGTWDPWLFFVAGIWLIISGRRLSSRTPATCVGRSAAR
jgi:hypothetical protein